SGRLPIARGEAGLEAVVRNTLGDTHTTPLSPRLTLDAEPEVIPAAVRMHAARGRFPLRHCCPRRTSLADAARTAPCPGRSRQRSAGSRRPPGRDPAGLDDAWECARRAIVKQARR